MTCKNCNHKISYIQSIHTGLIPKVGLKCPNCHKQMYYTAKSRKQSMYFVVVIPIVMIILQLFKISLPLTFGIAGLIGVITIFIFPFLFELTDEEEPLW
ncbi:TIGR04104 family putative zinc finger protein [Bacillaceae bacterium W0354]